jgi:hypothetical protein
MAILPQQHFIWVFFGKDWEESATNKRFTMYHSSSSKLANVRTCKGQFVNCQALIVTMAKVWNWLHCLCIKAKEQRHLCNKEVQNSEREWHITLMQWKCLFSWIPWRLKSNIGFSAEAASQVTELDNSLRIITGHENKELLSEAISSFRLFDILKLWEAVPER